MVLQKKPAKTIPGLLILQETVHNGLQDVLSNRKLIGPVTHLHQEDKESNCIRMNNYN